MLAIRSTSLVTRLSGAKLAPSGTHSASSKASSTSHTLSSSFAPRSFVRAYAKQQGKGAKGKGSNTAWKKSSHSSFQSGFHLSKTYRPTETAPHALGDDQAAMMAYNEAMESSTDLKSLSIEEVRRKANAKLNVEKVKQQLTFENEDPLIRQAYEELEDEDRVRRGLAPLRRAPPGKLKGRWAAQAQARAAAEAEAEEEEAQTP